ncbi:hypothetical protein [Roseospira goensis]|uniref:Uncharacterized protein n=1 Tax=Roseospira goensis TaxID=391922 RepID=A0A7W6S2Q2_9PROT|nr:hypothetical protein [Roseospira goensis]MBB4287097.1 hypothetical protein [Roseospira goensis]
MSAVFGLDALFSRKGEAAPAVQAAIPSSGRSRFEDLARTLGASAAPEAEPEGGDAPAAHGPAPDRRVMPFPRPHVVATTQTPRPEPAPGQGGSGQPVEPVADGPTRPWHHLREALSRRREAAEGGGRSSAARPEPAATRRGAAAVPAARGRFGPGPVPPWVRLSGRADGLRQTLAAAPAEEPGDLEVYLFGPERPPGTVGEDEVGAGEAASRRRHVSVRLPAREHELLRQFAKVCATTQQNVLRRALLTYMIDELRRRLDETPAQPTTGR